MDVLQRSRSSYNPTVSFRVYAIRVCSPRGVLVGPPRGRSPPLLGYPGSPHGGASVARPKMAPALPLTTLFTHSTFNRLPRFYTSELTYDLCFHSFRRTRNFTFVHFPPEFFNIPRYFGYAYGATCTCPFSLPPSFGPHAVRIEKCTVRFSEGHFQRLRRPRVFVRRCLLG